LSPEERSMSALVGHVAVERPREPAELTHYLYEKHGQRVFTFCYSRLRDRDETQDAVQTTFMYVLRSLQRGVEPEFELAWLLKIAFNVCRGTRRSSGRESAFTRDVEDLDELAAPPGAGFDGNERLDALRDGLGCLPERQRRGILLREWQGLSYAEIADELGLTVGAVETLLFRARRNLAARLQHVRSGVGAINIASLAPFFRSLARGALGKLALIGAGASVALIPVVATEIAPAIADRRAPVKLNAAASPPAGHASARRALTSSMRPRMGTHGAVAQTAADAAAVHGWLPVQPRQTAPTAPAATAAPQPTAEPSPATPHPSPSAPLPSPAPQSPSLEPPAVAPVYVDVPGQPPALQPANQLLDPVTNVLTDLQSPLPLP
jgi:RNA polymerase sigma-70 factor, ECF subfamily